MHIAHFNKEKSKTLLDKKIKLHIKEMYYQQTILLSILNKTFFKMWEDQPSPMLLKSEWPLELNQSAVLIQWNGVDCILTECDWSSKKSVHRDFNSH